METLTKTNMNKTHSYADVRVVNENEWYVDLVIQGHSCNASRVHGDITDAKNLRRAIKSWGKEKGHDIRQVNIIAEQ